MIFLLFVSVTIRVLIMMMSFGVLIFQCLDIVAVVEWIFTNKKIKNLPQISPGWSGIGGKLTDINKPAAHLPFSDTGLVEGSPIIIST